MKVSVCITTYNHEKYIAQALDSVLMQQADFNFEILVGEDQSSDSTRDIVRRYKANYPDIRLFLHDHPADYIRINGRKNFMNNLSHAEGEYIALLDGDDYWTDPFKLQKQVDFLETHPDCSSIFHRTNRLVHDQITTAGSVPKIIKDFYVVDDLLEFSNFIPTCSVVFNRTVIDEMPDWICITPYGDLPLHVLNSLRGKIAFINEPMAVRRVHEGGLYSGMSRLHQVINDLVCFEIILFHLGLNNCTYHKIVKCELENMLQDKSMLSDAASLMKVNVKKYLNYPSIIALQQELEMRVRVV